jgi:hypothetical protein
MWLVTRIGFFSAVAHRSEPGKVMVRARVRTDLIALCRLLKLGPVHKVIVETPHNDYPFRIIIDRRLWGVAMQKLGALVDYPNFKDEVARNDKARAWLLHDVWAILRRLDPRERCKALLAGVSPKDDIGPRGVTALEEHVAPEQLRRELPLAKARPRVTP